MDIKVLGLYLGKTVCNLAGLDEAGAVEFRNRLQRHLLLDLLDVLSPCVVAMEACGGSHRIGRSFLQKGHEPRLMSPLYVRPYVKVHKNDDRDAEAIAETATRPTISFVAIKSEEQLDLQALHRARERLVSDRTRLIKVPHHPENPPPIASGAAALAASRRRAAPLSHSSAAAQTGRRPASRRLTHAQLLPSLLERHPEVVPTNRSVAKTLPLTTSHRRA